jgi:cytochrome c oxidase assembly protein subunit 15
MDSAHHNLSLSRLAKFYVLLTFALILIGGMVTTSGAGMAFQTWPLSDGSVNPPGWTQDMAKTLEHSHRLVATLVAIVTAVLCSALWKNWLAIAVGPVTGALAGFIAWKFGATGALASVVGMTVNALAFSATLLARRRGPRSTEKNLALSAAWLVSLQAILGGLRVLIEAHVSPEAAIIFRVFHAVVAQGFLVLVVVLAARLSPVWRELAVLPHPKAGKFHRMAVALLGLYFVQIACAAYLRHKGIGMLIPTWPSAQPGGLLPVAWGHDVAIHFIHTRILPILIAGHVIGMAIGTAKRAAGFPRLTRVGWALLALVLVQFTLGVMVIWKTRQPHITNTHVLIGAAFCATAALYFARAGRLRAAIV